MRSDLGDKIGVPQERLEELAEKYYTQKPFPEIFEEIARDIHLTPAERSLLQFGLGYMYAKVEIPVIAKSTIIQ